MCISLRIQCVPAENNVWNAETVAYIQTVANLKSFITQTKSIAYFWEVKQLKIACYANVFLLKIYYGMYLGSSRFEGDFMKIFGMSLQQYSNALQCNYVSLLFVQSTAATLTRAHRSMCQFRAMPVLPSPLSACLPVASCGKQKKLQHQQQPQQVFHSCTQQPHCQWQVIEKRTESRQARLDNLYVATATVATVYLNVYG